MTVDLLQDIASQLNDIPCITLTTEGDKWQFHAEFSDEPRIALKQIRLAQKHPRQVKRRVNGCMKLIRQQYRQKIADTTYHPGVGAALLGGGYRRTRRSMASYEKNRLRAERDALLQPYEQVKDFIDLAILELDTQKAELE
jgi:hypothetical protein